MQGSRSRGGTQSESSRRESRPAPRQRPPAAPRTISSRGRNMRWAPRSGCCLTMASGTRAPSSSSTADHRSMLSSSRMEIRRKPRFQIKMSRWSLLQVQGHDRSTSAGKAAKRARTSLPGDEETESKCSSKKTSKSSAKGGAGEELCKDAGAGQAPASRGKSGGSGGSAVAARGGAGENAVAAASSDKAAASAGTKRSVSVCASERTL